MEASSKTHPLVLGIHVKHDASVALCSPEGIIAAIAEERISRIKHHCGFPRLALEQVLKTVNVKPEDISAVAFTTRRVLYPEHNNNFSIDAKGDVVKEKTAVVNSTRRWVKSFFTEKKVFKKETADHFSERHWLAFEGYLKELGLFREHIPHYYITHHRAHASSAFRLSGFSDACVVTLDGLGDGLCGTIYKGYSDGKMELLRSSEAKDSIGSFYQAITEALGFVPVDGEYKTMGLAAFGKGEGKNPFSEMVRVEDGVLHSRVQWKLRDFNKTYPEKKLPNPLSSISYADEFKKLLDSGMSREEFSFFAQEHCEDVMLSYARDAMRLAESCNIASAGGVMLNVKANTRIQKELKPDHFFVFPDSGDSGLAAGAAMEALYQMKALEGHATFGNPYLGHEYSPQEMKKEILAHARQNKFLVREATPEVIAEALVAGKVIGTFQGRLEMGPRALGNRSVIADPRNVTVKDRINKILKGREWFVPFAPALLEEDASRFWGGDKEYRYMTFAVPANEFAKKEVPAVVHVDGTMRPQMVSREWNPWFYNVLVEFKKLTGIGLLLNTSFNRHGLAIVGSPRDALEHLENGWVDALAMGPFFVEMKK